MIDHIILLIALLFLLFLLFSLINKRLDDKHIEKMAAVNSQILIKELEHKIAYANLDDNDKIKLSNYKISYDFLEIEE